MKRLFDVICALLLVLVLWPVIVAVAVVIWVKDGAPVFYVSERMHSAEKPFLLWKFRTMQHLATDTGVSGGDKAGRISQLGHVLRRTRMDELPQLWNILRGDMSFVGPRPPLRRYVEMFPELYGEVLKARPGVTGLATLAFHRREEALLRDCRTPQMTEAVYVARCIPVKARLDLIYARNQSLCFDARLMCATVFRKVPLRALKGRS